MTLYPYPPPLCIVCERFEPYTESCAAYPAEDGGIPIEILDGRWDHRKPAPGDRGIRFSPTDCYAKDEADLWLDKAVNPDAEGRRLTHPPVESRTGGVEGMGRRGRSREVKAIRLWARQLGNTIL